MKRQSSMKPVGVACGVHAAVARQAGRAPPALLVLEASAHANLLDAADVRSLQPLLSADGVPPVTEVRHMPGALQGLGPLPSPEGAYRYVLFNAFIVTVTTRSVRLAAATASLSFVALQVIQYHIRMASQAHWCSMRRAVICSAPEWADMKRSPPSWHLAQKDMFSKQSCRCPWPLPVVSGAGSYFCEAHTWHRTCSRGAQGAGVELSAPVVPATCMCTRPHCEAQLTASTRVTPNSVPCCRVRALS